MKTLGTLVSGLLLAASFACSTMAATTGELLQQGLYAEEVEGNMDAAIKWYSQVISNTTAPPNQVAQALYRQGICYLKLKNEAAARATLEKLVAEHSDQTELVDKAKPVLDELTDFDPAALMPAGTLLYLELGSPGKQIETIVGLLKGTPFENPLAAMGNAPGGDPNQRSPADIFGALLNPSMLAEFKKIRSAAIGITGIQQNNPPMVATLYPGKSDALRGLLLAALGMGGKPGEAMEGMQTVNIRINNQTSVAVAYDDRVFIAAMPGSQLPSCVKQYKGIASEPTLVSGNKSFAKVTKAQRQRNAITIWANVDEGYSKLLKLFPPNEIPNDIQKANAMVDFGNIDDVILTQSIESSGISSQLEIQFKDGHHCMPYDLIRTPNLNKAALEAVPAEAIALASFALGNTDPAQTELIRAKLQNVSGLDLGREVFANIEQVTLFAMPAKEGSSNTFLPASMGLAVTSRNPDQTRQVIGTLLHTASVLSSAAKGTRPGEYVIGAHGNETHCYLDQVNRTTLLALNEEIVRAAMRAGQQRQSVCVSGPLSSAVNRLSPAASKLILVNAGGALRLTAPQMKWGPLDETRAKQVKESIDQLARAADGTTLQLHTDETVDNLMAQTSVTGIPPLDKVIGPIATIQRISGEARAEAAARELREQIPITLRSATQAPVVDGQADEVWNVAESHKLEKVLTAWPESANNLSAEFKAMWDEKNLYVLVDVTDRVLRHDSDIGWQYNDGIELYLDCDNAKAPEFGDNDYQYSFNWDASSPEMKERRHDHSQNVAYVMVTTDKGYRLEAALPWSTLGVKPSAGAKIGLDVQVNDNQGNKKRDGKISWHDGSDAAWKTPRAFGVAELAGMVGWWKFDETQGSTALDSSGASHDGSLVGNAKWTKGRVGGAIDLDGKGSFVQIKDKSAFDFGNELTVTGWVNIRSVSSDWMAIVTKGDTAWRLSTLGKEPKFHFPINNYGSFVGEANGGRAVGLNEWHHVSGVYDGNTVRLYVDGKPEASAKASGGIARNEFEVVIGENAERSGRGFDGALDDVRIYNYALSENEIRALAVGQ